MSDAQKGTGLIARISTLNRVLFAVVLVVCGLVLADVMAGNKTLAQRMDTVQTLEQQKRDMDLLKALYGNLDKDQNGLEQALAFAENTESDTLAQSVKALSERHRLRLEWVDYPASGHPDPKREGSVTAVALTGDFEGVRGLLLDVLARPDVVGVPLIQVISGRGRLNAMFNILTRPAQRMEP